MQAGSTPLCDLARRRAALAVLVLCVAGASVAFFRESVPVQVLGSLSLGWGSFLARVVPRVSVSRAGLTTGILCLVLLFAGLHPFLRWLDREMRGGEGRWKPRWTASIVSVTVLMFASGIAMVGMTHQAGWLLAGKGRLVVERLPINDWRVGRTSEDNLKMIGLGVYNYHAVWDTLPFSERKGRGGLHSWQAVLQPQIAVIDQRINFDLAWDSPANSPAFRSVVPFYLYPGGTALRDHRGYALSYYAGNRHVFGRKTPLRFGDVQDGLSETIIVGEVATGLKPWGDPTNLRDPSRPFDGSPEAFGSPRGGGANVLMMDGSVRFITDRADPSVLRAMSGADLGR